ncbi:MAG: guanylate kinase [Spirochaetales bacterium]|nr:guanylate kinase [Spirochaetales bacterium]
MKKNFSIGIDCDDVLFRSNEYIIEKAQEEYGFDPPLTIEELVSWGKTGTRTDIIFKYYEDENFYNEQPLYESAQEFIKTLSKKANIYFITATPPEMMSFRAKRLVELFPEVPKENIIMTGRKDKVNVDMLLDDSPQNILDSEAKYPVLFRRPWNSNLSGLIAVNSFDDFLKLFEQIMKSYVALDEISDYANIINLIGPSGSGKTQLADYLILHYGNKYERPVSYTTKVCKDKHYKTVSFEEFKQMEKSGKLLETTVYGKDWYGMSKKEIMKIISNGKVPLILTDICGAIRLSSHYAYIKNVFVKRSREEIIMSILDKDIDNEHKTNRIMSLSAEFKNEEFCDLTVINNDIVESAEKIVRSFN